MADAVNYGRIAIVPRGDFAGDIQYDVGDVVSYDGSSYLAYSKPPLATLPTDTNYWQVSAQGSQENIGIATTEKVGLVKPDGETITIDENGVIKASSSNVVAGDNIVITKNEDGTQKISANISSKQDKNIVKNLTISIENWIENAEYSCLELLIEDENISASDVVNINLDVPSLEIANECGLKSVTVASYGAVNIYADSVPAAEMTGTMIIQKVI